MAIVITDDDAERLLSIPEAIDAMRVAFRDLSEGRAVNPPRLRYTASTPDATRRYAANIHAGSVESFAVACVRAGSNFVPVKQRRRPQGHDLRRDQLDHHPARTISIAASRSPSCTRRIFPASASAPPARWRCRRRRAKTPACSGCSAPASRRFRVAARSARCGRSSACRSTAPTLRTAPSSSRAWRAKNSKPIAMDDPREVVRGAHVVACCTNSKVPVLNGEWLEPGPDGHHHRQFGRHQCPPRGRTKPPSHARARSSSTIGTASTPTVRSNCPARSARAW